MNDEQSSSSDPGEDDRSERAESEGAVERARRSRRLAESAKRIDSAPGLVRAAKGVRELLPGDSSVGDALSSDGRPSDLLARALAADRDRPSTARQLGLAAVQVFQALGESAGRGHGERELAILFTDLVAYSTWALESGDEAAIELLRLVADEVEPVISDEGGQVVKRMGDGYMAVFSDADSAVRSALGAAAAVSSIELEGYRPRQRAGVHLGTPRKVGRDYLGVDVNIAARVAEAADADQVLVSAPVAGSLDDDVLGVKRRRFKAKGVPKGLEVYEVSAR